MTVTSDAVQLETELSDRGQVIHRQQIVNLPLNGRAYADLALLSPGVRKSVLNDQDSGGRDASFNVNGLRSSLNNFVVPNTNASSINRDRQGNAVPGGNYGRITDAYPARQIQFALELLF